MTYRRRTSTNPAILTIPISDKDADTEIDQHGHSVIVYPSETAVYGESHRPYENGDHHKHPEGDETPTDDADDDFPEFIDEEATGVMRYVAIVQNGISKFAEDNAKWIRIVVLLGIFILYKVFLVFAILHDWKKAEVITWLTVVAWVLGLYYYVFKPLFGKYAEKVVEAVTSVFDKLWAVLVFRIAFYACFFLALAVFFYFDTRNDRMRLVGLGGMAFFICFMFLASRAPTRVNWRPVIWGFFMQFCLGLLVLRWEWGSKTFHNASNEVVKFLDYTNNGTTFVYGFLAAPPNICGMDAVFAFSSIQVVVYFGAVVALLYYWGVMQKLLKWMAWFMQVTLGTTATESLNACACIFLGQSEAPLLIKPYLEKMTASELHAVMTSGFSCIAGSLFAAYISFGACPSYLLSSTVMSAPGSLACSKLLFPETQQTKLGKIEDLELAKSEESNALECISNGAVMAVELVMAILANLIVFLALLAFLDSTIAYCGNLIGQDGWSLEFFLGYAFFPLAYVMGVTHNAAETKRVAELMGTKTVLNEFIAYQKLGKMVGQKLLSPRSAMIATYALCGFSNFSSIGIQLGTLGGMMPKRKALLAKIALRALMAGSISCFMTASLAGVLVEKPMACSMQAAASNCFDPTLYAEVLQNITNPETNHTTLNTFLHSEL
uniref:Sodium/nucleoside cotransporter n=1 Tax=Panagrellus redivivus TaxID=6233 RepID=A0A7E4VBD1_PANRE